MKIVRFVSQVEHTNCTGCKMCERLCPTTAIIVIDKKATVDEKKCVACTQCWDVCPEDAIKMVSRPQPITFGLDPEEVDQTKVRELCIKAHILPEERVCSCSGTQAKEIAAAVIKGAKSLEDIALMTGTLAGCGIYCFTPVLRILQAYGVKVVPPKGHKWYDVTPSLCLWDIPEEIKQKYPGYFFEEDLKLIEERLK